MSDIRISCFIISLIVFLLSVAVFSNIHAGDFNTVGDVGCKSAAISNLKNLAGKSISFFGAGDYSYKCSSSTIKPYWDKINSKKGVQGNHECEKGEDSLKAGTYFGNGGCTRGYFGYTRGGNTGVIGLNPYGSYKVGSAQHTFVVMKINEYLNNPSISWIVFIIHPLFWPIGCSASHCHGVDEPAFNKIYEPLIRSSGKGFIVQAHTHLTAFGTPKGIPSVICGGGGEDATSLGSLNGYSWATNKPGYCKLHFESGKATATIIGTSNKVLHIHTWN